MTYRDLIGRWRINANGFLAVLELWQTGNLWVGRVRFDGNQNWENLVNPVLDSATLTLRFGRATPSQQYTGLLQFDELVGSFTQAGGATVYSWRGERVWPGLTMVESTKPNVKFVSTRSAAPDAKKVLVLVEERLLSGLMAPFAGGSTTLQRFLDDLQTEGWASFAYRYDVRSDESGEQGHRHLPSEVLQLYRYIRTFYHASEGSPCRCDPDR